MRALLQVQDKYKILIIVKIHKINKNSLILEKQENIMKKNSTLMIIMYINF